MHHSAKITRILGVLVFGIALSFGAVRGQEAASTEAEVAALAAPSHAREARASKAQEPALRREVRRDVTRWLRARQSILLRCERCGGDGVLRRVVSGVSGAKEKASGSGHTKVDTRSRYVTGLSTLDLRHAACHGLGKILRPRALEDLKASYLKEATEFPALLEALPSETGIRRLAADDKVAPEDRARTLIDRLGFIERGSAQVQTVELEESPQGVLFATVTTSVDPKETRWVRIDKRWKVLGPKDEQGLRAALEQDANQVGG